MDKLSFSKKLWLPLVLSLTALLAISIFSALVLRDVRLEERKNDLANISHAALSMVKAYGAQAESGVISKEEAQARARAALKSIRYGVDGYFAVANSSQVILIHPIKPELEGKDMTNVKDPVGYSLFLEITKAAGNPMAAT